MSFPKYEQYRSSGANWVGDIPAHWHVAALRWVAKRYAGGTPDKANPAYWSNGTIPWLNSGSVNQRMITEASEYITEDAYSNSSARWVPEGALVMALAGQGKTKGMVAQLAIRATCNQSMAAIVPAAEVNPRYLYWWLDAQYQNIRNLAGGDLRDGLNLDLLGQIPCPLPAKDEQSSISFFLDRETAKIDALVAEQERLIDLLEEKREAVISHAVTKGLDPKVPMKDSGVAWVGEVPAHWQVVKLGRIGACKGGAGFPDEYQGQVGLEIPFFKVADLTSAKRDGAMQDAAHTISRVTAKLLRAKVFQARTIVFAKVGAALLLQRYRWLAEPACIDNNMMGMTLHEGVEMRFLLYVLPLIDLSAIANPGAVPSINEGQISSQHLPLPPLLEQEKIVAHIEHETERLDSLIAEAGRAIGLLRERRSSLVSDAVTGQIDVRQLEVV